MQPKISVIIPAYNAAETLTAAVLSVVNQDYKGDVEIVIVNDHSSDNTHEVITNLVLRHSRQGMLIRTCNTDGNGISAARNTGFYCATGDFIVHMDADDRIPAHRLSMQVAQYAHASELLGMPYFVLSGCHSIWTTDGEHIATFPIAAAMQQINGAILASAAHPSHTTMFMPRACFNMVRGYRKEFKNAEDCDLIYRLAETYPIMYSPEVVYRYTVNPHSISHTQRNDERQYYIDCARLFAYQRSIFDKDELQVTGMMPQRRNVPMYANAFGGLATLDAASHVRSLRMGQAWQHHKNGERLQAVRTGLKSLATGHVIPSIAELRSLAALALK